MGGQIWSFLITLLSINVSINPQVPSREVDKSDGKFWSLWNKDTKEFFLQFAFKQERKGGGGGFGGPGGGGGGFGGGGGI